ncbi:unnamed protein product [Microthlaspi erraticum]|uniref:MPBQ/MBSQ family SAM-binding methyltransferase profile domain-containing protein n=1 Tax=Microthlaspi erraticum TaxID=1685480 RepID=A0A6D2JUL1_9BRAS|nr:unnamed protein product [Microthlaspi erraticum]
MGQEYVWSVSVSCSTDFHISPLFFFCVSLRIHHGFCDAQRGHRHHLPQGLGFPGFNLHCRPIHRPNSVSVPQRRDSRWQPDAACRRHGRWRNLGSYSTRKRLTGSTGSYPSLRLPPSMHHTEDMRDAFLEPADLSHPDLRVVDVGGGSGFTTLGIVKTVNAKNVTILDLSPHQLAKAKEKEALKECKFLEGDAEDLPFPTDYADRYVSAGSIDYWPEPQRGIREAYRVSRFQGRSVKTIAPKWYRGVRRHGLVMGCSVTGVKPASGDSPLQIGPKEEDVEKPVNNRFVFLGRFLLGTLAAAWYLVIPIYMWIKDKIVPKGQPI